MYNISHKRSTIEQRLRTNYQKINYNRFRWWRWYQDKNSPLPYKSEFRDKIFNGDFDPSGYIWQAMLCEHMLNDMQSKTSDGQLDHTSTEALFNSTPFVGYIIHSPLILMLLKS